MQISDIHSPSDLLSVALATAEEGDNYFACCQAEMSLCENAPSAAVFKALVESERERQRMLRNWAEAENLMATEGMSPLKWRDPNVADTYDAAAVDPIRSTPYRVLAMSAHRAEHSFRFYTYVAAYSNEVATREYAEILAGEELERATQARTQRRASWHAERAQLPQQPELNPANVASLADLLCVATSLEHCAGIGLSHLIAHYPALSHVVLASTGTLDDIRSLAGAAGVCSEDVAAEALAIDEFCQARSHSGGEAATLLLPLYADLDRCFSYYDALVSCTDDEAIMLQAQQFAFSAMARIDLVQEAVLA